MGGFPTPPGTSTQQQALLLNVLGRERRGSEVSFLGVLGR